MTDELQRLAGLPSGPAKDAFTITPSDSTDLTTYARGFVIGAAGVVKITTLKGTTITTPSLPAGFVPIAITRFWSTGTDAAVKTAGVMGLAD